MDYFRLTNKNILITGASSGIGRQCAISCAQAGANVILIARNKIELEKTFNYLTNGNHGVFQFDITKYNQINDIINQIVEKHGKISGFIHSAGFELSKPLQITEPVDYENIMAVNLIAALEFIKYISKKKNRTENTSYVLISSILGLFGKASLTAYSAAKGAINSSVKSLAIELAPKQIRINSILPGWIADTNLMHDAERKFGENFISELEKQYPLKLGSTIDVANACIFLLSNASKWITGTNLILDGGFSAQ